MNKQGVVSNTLWILGDKVLKICTGIILTGAIARLLGPNEYGALAYTTAFVTFFYTLSQLGMDRVILRDLSISSEATPILEAAFSLRVTAAVIAAALCATIPFGMPHLFDERQIILILIAAPTIIFQATEILEIRFQAVSEVANTIKLRQVAHLVATLLRIGALQLSCSVNTFVALNVIEMLLIASLVWRQHKKKFGQFALSIAPIAKYGKILTQSWPIAFSAIAIYGMNRLDQILISNILGNQSLGYYAAIYPLSTATLYVVPSSLCIAFAPHIANAFEIGRPLYHQTLRDLISIVFYSCGLICVAISVLAPQIISVVYGGTYAQSSALLSTHVWTLLFSGLGLVQSHILVNENRNRLLIVKTVVGASIGLLINFSALKTHGIMTAPIAALLAEVAAFATVIALLPKDLRTLHFDALRSNPVRVISRFRKK